MCIIKKLFKKCKKVENDAEMYKTIIDSALEGYWSVSPDGRILDVNPAACRMLGYTRKELLKMSVPDIEFNEDPAEVAEHTLKIIEKGGDIFQSRHKRKDGTPIDTEVSVSVIMSDGRPSLYAFVRDITEKKIIEERLQMDEERLESLFNLYNSVMLTEKELSVYALEECVRLTKSKVGYYHLFNEDEQTIQLNIWSKETYNNCTSEQDQHYPIKDAGIWAEPARTKKPVLHNDYKLVVGKKGLPEGHFPVIRHMGVPVIEEGKVVAIVGVGNKETPYDERDIRQLQLFMNSVWVIIRNRRIEKELKQKLREFETVYKATMEREKKIIELKDEIQKLKKA